jgi:hypothetical protein
MDSEEYLDWEDYLDSAQGKMSGLWFTWSMGRWRRRQEMTRGIMGS